MTRPDSSLLRHLLTRSDLASMAIPAAVILDWLEAGALEAVGVLDDDADGDPVFTVTSPELRCELQPRLAGIDKPAVVLSPLRVRSILMRARLANAAATVADASGTTPAPFVEEPTSAPEHPRTVADRLAATDLANVLQEVAAEIDADLEVMLKLAEEEAQIEAGTDLGRPDTAATDQLTDRPTDRPAFMPTSEPQADGDGGLFESSANGDEACFDIDDLAEAFETERLDSAAATEPIAEVAAPKPADGELEGHAAPAASTTTITGELVPARNTMASESLLPPTAGSAEAEERDELAAPMPSPAGGDAAMVEPATAAAAAIDSAVATAALARTGDSLLRVESFLGELKHALIDLALRPTQAPIDVKPLVVAVQTGFEQASAQTSATNAVLTTLSDRIGGLGQQVEQGMQQAVTALAAREVATSAPGQSAAGPAPTRFVVATSERTPVALLALAALVSGWSVLFWLKTGSIRLALGTLITANLIGCCLLLARRQR